MTDPWYALQSTHNEETFRYLQSGGDCYVDWEVTTLFDSALHMVNRYFAENNLEIPQNHDARSNLLKRINPPSLYKNYMELHTLSRKARYTVGHLMHNYERKIALKAFFSFKNGLDSMLTKT